MPELPEVETTMRGILPHVKQQTIARVVVREHRLRWPVPPDIQSILRNKTIDDVSARQHYSVPWYVMAFACFNEKWRLATAFVLRGQYRLMDKHQ